MTRALANLTSGPDRVGLDVVRPLLLAIERVTAELDRRHGEGAGNVVPLRRR
ncbi:MAG: hypothetical protein IPG04_14660 [Polyangiaceae bacterium]|nr:hypothetical protein [Polyangiaceae bacterium]